MCRQLKVIIENTSAAIQAMYNVFLQTLTGDLFAVQTYALLILRILLELSAK